MDQIPTTGEIAKRPSKPSLSVLGIAATVLVGVVAAGAIIFATGALDEDSSSSVAVSQPAADDRLTDKLVEMDRRDNIPFASAEALSASRATIDGKLQVMDVADNDGFCQACVDSWVVANLDGATSGEERMTLKLAQMDAHDNAVFTNS